MANIDAISKMASMLTILFFVKRMSTACYKTVLIGNSGVGKTSIMARLISGTFNISTYPTIGAMFIRHQMETRSGQKISLDIWDTAGEERFSALMPMYTRSADLILIVYDVTDEISYCSLPKWVNFLPPELSNSTIVLFANKTDAITESDEFLIDQGRDFARTNKYLFYSISAKSGIGLNDAFNDIIETVVKTPPLASANQSLINPDVVPLSEHKRRCCRT